MIFRSPWLAKKMRQVSGKGIELGSVGAPAEDIETQTPKGSSGSGSGSHLENTEPGPPSPVGAGKPSFSRYRQWALAHYERARKFVLDIQDVPPTKDGRHIPLEPSRTDPLIDERTGKPYISNLIRSSKYTPWNFLPRQLFAQFSKLANFYFLVISILQLIPGLSTTGTYTTIAPLLFFVALSIAKEGYEDLRRHRLDRVENNRFVNVLGNAGRHDVETTKWQSIKWSALQVGDVIRLERDEPVPADAVLLGSKGSNNTAYVETMALDGETNLKPKQPSPSTVQAASTVETLADSTMHFIVEDPNTDLYSWEARITINGQTSPLTNNEILYRGSVIRNTPECFAMVVYSGEECKIRMNSNKHPRIKAPALQAAVNKVVIGMAGFVVFLAFFNSIAYQIWQDTHEEESWFISNAPVSFGPLWTSFLIMFFTLLPLSLYISLEIIKVAQMVQMNDDIDMYDPESDTPFEAHTSTINEELGQVGYIFSDKTGTLTENVMKFRKMSIAGTAWLHDLDLRKNQLEDVQQKSSKGKQKRPSTKSSSSTFGSPQLSRFPTWQSPAVPVTSDAVKNTRELVEFLRWNAGTALAESARMMILSMALCHTCLPERKQDDNDDEITFQASSPDELALLQAARELGYLAYERDGPVLTLKTYPQGHASAAVIDRYEILHVIEFSSQRKRMSIVVRLPDGRVMVICKGADSVIMARLRLASLASQKLAEIENEHRRRQSMQADMEVRRSHSMAEYARQGSVSSNPFFGPRSANGRASSVRDDANEWVTEEETTSGEQSRLSISPRESIPLDEELAIERCLQHINDFATEGLRTLLYGYRFLDEEDYQEWSQIYHNATTSLVDRTTQIERAGELIEQDLELAGATAIEDKLQEGVPETIDRLRRANIKMWMLTGDKRETAITIGHSCRLIKDFSTVTILDSELDDVLQKISPSILEIKAGGIAHSVIVVDGQTLATIQSDSSSENLFLDLAILTDSVICCRASPSQKASLVHAIRTRIKGSVTLAIGDGANDIAMIQEAQVGIGLTGKEGHQAARVSDYSIARFRFLGKLLLVHGRWNYIRTCKYVVGTFWKEVVFYLTQALYQRHNGFSATSLYEPWSLTLFNALFTSLPIIFLGTFEQDLRSSTLLSVPELYTKGQKSLGFNWKVFVGWMFTAVVQAMIIWFTAESLWAETPSFSSDNGIYPIGVLTYTASVVIINLKLQFIEQQYKSVMAVLAIGLSIAVWALWNVAIAGLYSDDLKYSVKNGLLDRWGRDGVWWLTLLVIILASCIFEYGARALKSAFFHTDVETFQALEKDPKMRQKFEEESKMWLGGGLQDGSESHTHQQRYRADGKDFLDRPQHVEEGRSRNDVDLTSEEEIVMVAERPVRTRTDMSDMLSRRFKLPRRGA